MTNLWRKWWRIVVVVVVAVAVVLLLLLLLADQLLDHAILICRYVLG